MHEFVFVLKISKFCNLRCAYCYEHRELHVRDTMRLDTLTSLFAGVDAFGDYLLNLGIAPKFSFVWHGGEPLLLPPKYFRTIAALQAEHICKFPYENSVQTNLYGARVRESLACILALRWKLSVSIDFARDVRHTAAGRETNRNTMTAAEGLHRAGVKFGVISVLGAHNVDSIPLAYDWVARHAESWRLLPVFDGGPEETIARLRLAEDETIGTLVDIFRRRASGQYISIEPLDSYLQVAALRIADDRSEIDLVRPSVDNIYIVNVNGDVFTRPFAYDPKYCLGNIGEAGMPEILASDAYSRCRRTVVVRKINNCLACEHLGFCDSSPMHEHGTVVRNDGHERCTVPRQAVNAIQKELIGAGITSAVIGRWARDWLADSNRRICAPSAQ